MEKNWNKIGTVASGISAIVGLLALLLDHESFVLYVCIAIVVISSLISGYYWIKSYPIERRYKFVRYLFLELYENKFNIAPKLLLYYDLMKKGNAFYIEKVSVLYDLKNDGNKIDCDMTWRLEGIENVKENDFYFYTGIDRGKIKNQQLIVYVNNEKHTIPLLTDNVFYSGNGVYLCHWNIPKEAVKSGNKIDKIELLMSTKESFDFSSKEVIYFFPWNFGAKIKKLEFAISFPEKLEKIYVQLFEVGKIKGKKYPMHQSISTTSNENYSPDETTDKKIYTFRGLENINMQNLYYFLLHKEAFGQDKT
ncbi:hypothetical protein [Blautia sp. MSJ-19]|uniref:hypothetical protein n=1 Tax=Blautia sp. MSJ-19 TaxID=2841517 RepID=UPI001C0EB60F|nr:hypothetical protein [Blautia sp. MSJ-19]MBU5481551.1 hypothetical protein [Blautia sp. MSJ-19]